MTSKDAGQMLQVSNHLDKVKKHTLCLICGRSALHEVSTMEPNVKEKSFMQASRSIEGQKYRSCGILQPFAVLVT